MFPAVSTLGTGLGRGTGPQSCWEEAICPGHLRHTLPRLTWVPRRGLCLSSCPCAPAPARAPTEGCLWPGPENTPACGYTGTRREAVGDKRRLCSEDTGARVPQHHGDSLRGQGGLCAEARPSGQPRLALGESGGHREQTRSLAAHACARAEGPWLGESESRPDGRTVRGSGTAPGRWVGLRRPWHVRR